MFLGTPQRLQFSGEAVVLPASPPSVHRLLAAIVASESAFYEGRVSDGACLPSRVGRAGPGFGGEPRGARALPAPSPPLQISLDHLPSLILERVRGLESVAGIRPESASLAPFPHHHSAARCRRDDSFLRTRFRGRGGRGRPSSAHTPSHGLSSRSSRTPGSIHPSSEVMLLQ